MSPETTRHLVCTYGSTYPDVLDYQKQDPNATDRISDQSPVIKAEILHGIHEEMAQKVVDVVMRRTELGSFGHPGDPCLRTCAAIMAAELGWNNSQTNRELAEAEAVFSSVNKVNPRPSLLALDQRQDVAGTLSRR